MAGWIKVHRKMLDNPIVCKDADYLSIWMYLLLNATHTNYDSIFNGKRIALMPGQLITGRKSISSDLKIDESKVQRVLKVFEQERQIEQQTCNKNRLITILSWDKYQDSEQQNEQPVNSTFNTFTEVVDTKTSKSEQQMNSYNIDKSIDEQTYKIKSEQQVNNNCTTSEQPVNTNKNVKNIKNVKNNTYSIFDAYSQNEKLRQVLRDFSIMRNKIKAPLTERAANMLLNELNSLAATDETKIEILEKSILNSWKSVYPLRKQETNKKPVANNKFHNFDSRIADMGEQELEEIANKRLEKLRGQIR